jgi:hypothetical protein
LLLASFVASFLYRWLLLSLATFIAGNSLLLTILVGVGFCTGDGFTSTSDVLRVIFDIDLSAIFYSCGNNVAAALQPG